MRANTEPDFYSDSSIFTDLITPLRIEECPDDTKLPQRKS